MSLVTVVIPTWNRPEYLKRCLASVHAQTFKDYDVVVVDDHSAMEAEYREVVRDFSEKMPLRYVRLPLNRGSQYCRNKGLSLASGQYIAFIDDDDEWLPTKLERQVMAFEAGPPDLGLVYTWVDSRTSDGQTGYEYRESHRGQLLNPLLDHCFIPSCSVMCRFDAVVEAGRFDEGFPSCQDWDMWTRIVEKGYSYDLVEEVLAIHHEHEGYSIGKSSGSLTGYRMYFEKHASYYARCGMLKNLSEKYRGLGWVYFLNGNTGSASELLNRSLHVWKFNTKSWIRITQVFGSKIVRKIKSKHPQITNPATSTLVSRPAFSGLRFNRDVLAELMIEGKNIIEPWGVEFADSHSFFSLEEGIGYRYDVLDKSERMCDTARSICQTIRMREGLVRLELKEWLEDPISLRRVLHLTCLEKTNLMDFVLRFRFKQALFEEGFIDNKRLKGETLPIYHQYPVDSVGIRNPQYGIQVSIVNKFVPPNMKSVMYLKSAEGSWVIHARMLPRLWNKEVIKLCSNLFKTRPMPPWITDQFLKSKTIREALWYRGERSPYRNRIARLFSPNAYPIAEMQKGTEMIWDVRCRVDTSIKNYSNEKA